MIPHNRAQMADREGRPTRDWYDWFRRLGELYGESTGVATIPNLPRLKTINNEAIAGSGNIETGYRDIPQVIQNANATFELQDRGYHWIKTNTTAYAWTIPPSSAVDFPIGTTIVVINDSGTGAVTITRGSGVVLMDSGTDANFSLAVNTGRTLIKIGTDRWRIM